MVQPSAKLQSAHTRRLASRVQNIAMFSYRKGEMRHPHTKGCPCVSKQTNQQASKQASKQTKKQTNKQTKYQKAITSQMPSSSRLWGCHEGDDLQPRQRLQGKASGYNYMRTLFGVRLLRGYPLRGTLFGYGQGKPTGHHRLGGCIILRQTHSPDTTIKVSDPPIPATFCDYRTDASGKPRF